MKIKVLVTTIILVLICVLVAIRVRHNVVRDDKQSEENIKIEESSSDRGGDSVRIQEHETNINKVSGNDRSTTSTEGIDANYKKPFSFSPNPSEYQEKIDNSQVLDSSLRPFAYQMAQSMSQAKQDITKAKEVFEKFKTCAGADSSQEIFAVRASCAENLRTLAKLYPDQFGKEYRKLEAKFPEDVKKAMF